MRRGPVFRQANVPVPEKWQDFRFEYRTGYDAGTRFKAYFPAPGADSWSERARNAFRAGWKDARALATAPTDTQRLDALAKLLSDGDRTIELWRAGPNDALVISDPVPAECDAKEYGEGATLRDALDSLIAHEGKPLDPKRSL